jgi:pimeloyl-ACP methyl ester carboxylesterase
MSNSRIIVAVLFAGCVVAGSVAAPAGRIASALSPEQAMTPYLTPQRMVQIGETRTINLVCLGHGSPTVILSAGMGGWSFNWGLVQPALAERTRVCAWDRAGTGFSSPSPEPQDILHTTQDLERALQKAGIRGPYVMVGHSLGAFESLRFTDLHRQSVVGMVLVDPDIPGRFALDERIAPQFAALSRVLQDQAVKQRSGTPKSGTVQFERCTASPVPAALPHLKAAMERLNADPMRLLNQASIEEDHGNSSRQATDARRNYGDMPLIVLTAGRGDRGGNRGTERELGTLGCASPSLFKSVENWGQGACLFPARDYSRVAFRSQDKCRDH